MVISRWSRLLLVGLLALGGSAPAWAQGEAQAPSASAATGQSLLDFLNAMQDKLECEGTRCTLIGRAQLDLPGNAKFSADHIELVGETGLIIGTGNVVFASTEGRLAAEKVEYNWTDGTGTFYEASGMMTLGATVDRAQFGGQEPDVAFGGERIEKVGPRRYRIIKGWLSTCVQPTRRWELRSGTMEVNLNDYAIAKHTVLRVKGVPMMYLPVVYYPMQEDERATGFLLPTYGNSTLRGQTVSNAFFWALGRSHDATFFHDWFTKAGQGVGAEYRFVTGSRSYGNARLFRFSQRESEYVSDGQTRVLPQANSYEVQGTITHALNNNVRVGARFDYASNILTQQLYNQDVYRSSNPMRVIDGNIAGSFGATAFSAQYQRTEVFSDASRSNIYGGTPRTSASLAPQRLFGGPIYGSVNGEFGYLPYKEMRDGRVLEDKSLARFDVTPTVRVPLSTLTFLTVNSTATYRTTYYTRSREGGVFVPEPLARTYLSMRADVIGPVFSKIWETPSSLASDRKKHVIEPTFAFDYVTPIDDFRRMPIQSDTSDVIVGDSARLTYGITNRLFLRTRPEGSVRGTTREYLTLGVQQTYYSNREASRWDTQYYTASSREKLVDLSPIAFIARMTPTPTIEASSRVEYDLSGLGFNVLSGSGSFTAGASRASLSYSRIVSRRTDIPSHTISGNNTVQFLQRRLNGTYAISWDLARDYILSQSVGATYLAQCCGITLEFQRYNYPATQGFPLPSDTRFNIGFVLAGLGSVPISNFFGSFGGAQR